MSGYEGEPAGERAIVLELADVLRGDPLVELVVAGTPVAQGSKKVVPAGGFHRAVETNEKNLRPWRAAIAAAARDAMDLADPSRQPIALELEFSSPRPASHYGTGRNAGELRASAPAAKVTMPDVDKLARAMLDGLTGIVFVDDAQVVELTARKCYGPAEARVRAWEWKP